MPPRPADQFLYERRGPWPQPSPHAGWQLAPAVLALPREEQADFDEHVGLRIALQVYLDPVLRARCWLKARSKLERVSPADFVSLLTRGAFSRFLNPHLDPWDRETFAEVLGEVEAGEGELFKVDFTAMAQVRPFAGMHVAPTVTLLRRSNGRFEPLAIAIAPGPGDAPAEGASWSDAGAGWVVLRPRDPAWDLAQYFVLQGASNHLILLVHPQLHFPMDAVNAVSKTVLTRDHLLLRLLLPHTRFTLPLDKGVLERDDIVLGDTLDDRGRLYDALRARGERRRDLALLAGARFGMPRGMLALERLLEGRPDDDTDDLRAPFVAPKDQLVGLNVIGYSGIPGNSSYPRATFPSPPRPIHSDYGEFLERYYEEIRAFVGEVVAALEIAVEGPNAAEARLALEQGWLAPDEGDALRRRADEAGRRLVDLLHERPLPSAAFAALRLEHATARQEALALRMGSLEPDEAAKLRARARREGRSLAAVALEQGAVGREAADWLERADDDAEQVRRWAEYLAPWIQAYPEGTPDLLREVARGRRGLPDRDHLADFIARYIWTVSVGHAADHWSLVNQISLAKAPLRLRVPAPRGPELPGPQLPGDGLDRDALVTVGDMARTWFANEVFFEPTTVTRLCETRYVFDGLPIARQLSAANDRFLAGLRAAAAGIPAGEFVPLQEISASIQY